LFLEIPINTLSITILLIYRIIVAYITIVQPKKNPPINEQMIKSMMTGMGRTPSQKQVNQMMKTMSKYMD